MIDTFSFGEWVKQRRQSLRRTQREIAAAVYCSVAMIKKIEADERHPSLELAQALAAALEIPAEQHVIFVKCARGEQPVDQLTQTHPPASLSQSFGPPLPRPTTPFIGRQAELTDITNKLNQPNCRLLTLLGPGGIGKTRLAIEAARTIQGDFGDGALFTPLATVIDSTQIRVAIGDWIFRLGQVQCYLGELDAAEANLQETMQLYEEVGNRFGPPGVLSNLALVALERENEALALRMIQESFSRYRNLQESMHKVDRSANFLEFGDTIESLLQAGLVAHALKEWESAIYRNSKLLEKGP